MQPVNGRLGEKVWSGDTPKATEKPNKKRMMMRVMGKGAESAQDKTMMMLCE